MTVSEALAARRTVKVFADLDSPPDVPPGLLDDVRAAVADAGWAPFHYPAHKSHRDDSSHPGALPSPVPWRMHVIDHAACRTLAALLGEGGDATLADVAGGKLPQMLAAAGAVVAVTWLPHPAERENAKLTQMNEEHLMAAAAATQSLLLGLTARSIRSYWSSGGAVADRRLLDRLGCGPGERLAAAVFAWPPRTDGETSVPGKHRDTRGHVSDWSRLVTAVS